MNQVECHPYLSQSKLKEFCEKHGILITGFSPLRSPDKPFKLYDVIGNGLLANLDSCMLNQVSLESNV